MSLVLVKLIMTGINDDDYYPDYNDDGNDDDEEYEGKADAYRS